MQYVKFTFIISLTASIFAVSAAFFMEHIMYLIPCKLCFIQRKLYYIIIIADLIGLYFYLKDKKISIEYEKVLAKKNASSDFSINKIQIYKNYLNFFCLLIIFISLVSACIAGFHFGVEQKLFFYNSSCTFDMTNDMTIEQFQEKIAMADLVSCDIPQGVFLNISIAGWNCIYSFGLFIMLILSYKKLLPKFIYNILNKF